MQHPLLKLPADSVVSVASTGNKLGLYLQDRRVVERMAGNALQELGYP